MTASRMDRQAGREFGIAIMEHDAARIIEPHDAADVLDLEGMRQPRISHVPARGIGDFAFLEMEARLRKLVEIPDVIIVQMGQDHIFDCTHINVERGECLDRATQECPGFAFSIRPR